MKIKKYFIPKRRSFIKLAAFSVATITVLSIFLLRASTTQNYYENEIKTVRLRSLYQMCEYTSLLPDDLHKLANSAAPTAELSSNILKNTSCAKTCLSDFPQDNDSLSQIYKFYSQVDSLITSISNGSLSIEQEQSNLRRLADSAQNLTYRLEDVLNMCITGSLSLTQVPDAIADNQTAFYSSGLDYANNTLADIKTNSFKGAEESAFLNHFDTVTKKEAAKIAAEHLNVETVLLRKTRNDDSSLELYKFYYRDSFISITKNGGKVCSFFMPCEAKEKTLSAEDAVIRAKEALKNWGYKSLKEKYYFIKDNVCTITFVHIDGEVICYPDTIKIKIALDNGETVGFDASEYFKNHKERSYKYENTFIEGMIPSSLNVLRISLALISHEGTEILCHEILCTDGESEYLVYLNSENAAQEKILKLEKTDSGTLIK
ncbi:MAG: germination protein YpeB [Clostridia bacterium]|nr:germination protein YpeB [Clostridia bacterium]